MTQRRNGWPLLVMAALAVVAFCAAAKMQGDTVYLPLQRCK